MKPGDIIVLGKHEVASMPERTNRHIVQTVRCSVCRAVRGAANHWFVVCRLDNGREFIVEPFDPNKPLNYFDEPVCGNTCAHKKLDEYLSAPAVRR